MSRHIGFIMLIHNTGAKLEDNPSLTMCLVRIPRTSCWSKPESNFSLILFFTSSINFHISTCAANNRGLNTKTNMTPWSRINTKPLLSFHAPAELPCQHSISYFFIYGDHHLFQYTFVYTSSSRSHGRTFHNILCIWSSTPRMKCFWTAAGTSNWYRVDSPRSINQIFVSARAPILFSNSNATDFIYYKDIKKNPENLASFKKKVYLCIQNDEV